MRLRRTKYYRGLQQNPKPLPKPKGHSFNSSRWLINNYCYRSINDRSLILYMRYLLNDPAQRENALNYLMAKRFPPDVEPLERATPVEYPILIMTINLPKEDDGEDES